MTDAWIEASHRAKQPESRQSSTLADHVYGRLVEDILSCRLKPGSKLHQKELSAAYGTAGSAVREALSQLASMGLVVAEPQRGFRVAETSIEDLIDLTVSRIWVESIALRSAIARGAAPGRRTSLPPPTCWARSSPGGRFAGRAHQS